MRILIVSSGSISSSELMRLLAQAMPSIPVNEVFERETPIPITAHEVQLNSVTLHDELRPDKKRAKDHFNGMSKRHRNKM